MKPSAEPITPPPVARLRCQTQIEIGSAVSAEFQETGMNPVYSRWYS
jgi:hypothetical protein